MPAPGPALFLSESSSSSNGRGAARMTLNAGNGTIRVSAIQIDGTLSPLPANAGFNGITAE